MTPSSHIMPEVVTPLGLDLRRPDRAWRDARVAFLAAMLLHGGFAGLFVFDDLRLSSQSPASRDEVSVDLVDESEITDGKAADANKPPGGPAGEAKAPDRQADKGRETVKQPELAAKAEGSRQTRAEKPAPVEERPPAVSSAPSQTGARQPPAGPVQPPPAPARGGSTSDRPKTPPETPPASVVGEGVRPLPKLPTFAMPGLVGATAAPSAGNALSEDYKGTVYGMLESVKRYPDTARARQAVGTVVVTFEIDDAGAPRSIRLVRTSGHADLDREAVAMVERAAPYPAPPKGVGRAFAPAITFGLN